MATIAPTPLDMDAPRFSTESLDDCPATVRMYTPAMMADMLGISVRAIRLWVRSNLLRPTKVVMKVPYFDYTALTSARTFAQWLKEGVSAHSIAHQVSALSRLLDTDPNEVVDEPSISLEGKRLVLTRESVHVDSSGQFQLGFSASSDDREDEPITLKLAKPVQEIAESESDPSLLGLLDAAANAEDREDFDSAAKIYRDLLAAYGPNPEVCFQLAEILYRQADLSGARERYFMALELEPGLVEARANLGCILIECGELDQAIAAFQQALRQFSEYADVHFHLARALEMRGQNSEAIEHWQNFLRLAPASPWADEAMARLAEHPSLARNPIDTDD